MKNRFTTLLLPFLFFGCTTAQLDTAEKTAIPIAEAVAVAAGAYYGVPPSASTAAIGGVNSLWGAYQQAQAGQPVAQGAVSTSIGKAIAGATAGMAQTDKLAALRAAAQLLQTQGPPSATVNAWGSEGRVNQNAAELHRRLVRNFRGAQ